MPPHDADDVVQEVFVTAWKRAHTLRDPRGLAAWLAAIARNACAASRRRAARRLARERRGEEELGEEVSGAPAVRGEAGDPELRQSEREESRRILRALAELPASYRHVLALRLVEGWTGPEIARATGRTEGTVRVQLTRGRELMRERLEREGVRP